MLQSSTGGQIFLGDDMEFKNKISLSKHPIVLFKEGPFLKLYNQSLFVANKLLGFGLKPVVKKIKKVDEIVIFSGIPVTSLYKYFPNAKATQYGYQVQGEFDLSYYLSWYNQLSATLAMRNDTITLTTALATTLTTTLTIEQLQFLSSWQPNKYPNNIDSAFIAELKQHFKL